MYRAHIQVYDENGKRLGAKALATALPGRATGTRHGAPGLWVERKFKAEFEEAVQWRRNAILAMGYSLRVGCTNQPSFEAVRWMRSNGQQGPVIVERG